MFKIVLLYITGELHVIEGDVVLRGQGTSLQMLEPIMASLPKVSGDLTLSEWITLVKDAHKAVKLDFQTIEAIEISLQILNKLESKVLSF